MNGPFFLLLSNPIFGLFYILSLVVAITVHEFAHAKMADSLGDPTPRIEGRLTLDPRAHLDVFGSIMILFVGFGWGRPVRFDPYNLTNPRTDAMKIAFAGPISNIMMALGAAIVVKVVAILTPGLSSLTEAMLGLFIQLNVYLAVFNMLPVEPLDGFKVVAGLLPHDQAEKWQTLAPYGMIFLLLLVFLPPAPGIQLVSTVSRWILQFLL